MRVRIFKPARSVMQSGRAKTAHWTIEPELTSSRTPDPVMGWARGDDTMGELKGRLVFDTKEEAMAFAQAQGWEASLFEPKTRKVQPRNYLDNFKWKRPQDEKAG